MLDTLRDAFNGQFDWAKILVGLLSSFIVIFLTMPIHEWAHGFVSTRLGDPTPRYQGRLTLNPMAHIDPIGALGILLFGIGWARPVQVNARYYKSPKWGMALVAAAGPVSNIIVAFISMFVANAIVTIGIYTDSGFGIINFIYDFFYYVAIINVSLAVFNLIPIPPFDGSRILFTFLPQRYYFKIMQYERFIFIGLLAIIYTGVLNLPLQYVSGVVFSFINNLAALPFISFLN